MEDKPDPSDAEQKNRWSYSVFLSTSWSDCIVKI